MLLRGVRAQDLLNLQVKRVNRVLALENMRILFLDSLLEY